MTRKLKITLKVPRPRPRNPVALPAKKRRAGPLKDRRTPRGGAKNPDWQEEMEEDGLLPGP